MILCVGNYGLGAYLGYYKAIPDMQTSSTLCLGSHFVKLPPFLPWDKSAMSLYPQIFLGAYCNVVPDSLQAYVAFSRFDKILGRFLTPMSKRI